MNIDSAVVLRYITLLNDHPILCDWAKIVSKISRENLQFFAALIASNWPEWHNAGDPPLPYLVLSYRVTPNSNI